MPNDQTERATDQVGWEYDAYEYLHPVPKHNARYPGRPTCLEDGTFTIKSLRTAYQQTRSIVKTAALLGVSPTTVKKYLHGSLKERGRPIQPASWKTKCRSQVHAWFAENKGRQLPRTSKEIAELSGFSMEQVNRYLWSRKKAMESYLASLPPLNSRIVVLTDLNGQKVPSNLIKDYSTSIDRISADVTISAVLTLGGLRVIRLPFRQYEAVLLGKNPDIPVIGLVKPKQTQGRTYDPLKPPRF